MPGVRRRGGVRRRHVLLGLVIVHGTVGAQDAARPLASCEGKVISGIVITPHDPALRVLPRPFRFIARAIGSLQTTTKADVIGRFLLLAVGSRCRERERAESERILRLQPFLAEATVRTVADSAGGVRVEVETIDEVPGVIAMKLRDGRPSALRFGSGNVDGQGLYLVANLERGFAYRTGAGITAIARQVFGRPYSLAFVGERATLGSKFSLSFTRPFFTDLQRTAWHMGYGTANRYRSFVRPDLEPIALGVRRELWNVGGVRRIGIGRRQAFAGVLVTHEDVRSERHGVVISDSGLVADTTAALGEPLAGIRSLRLHAVAGLRALSFMPVRGFDALVAAQDVATGVQIGALLGRGLRRFGDSDDRFVAGDLYLGHGSATSFAAVRVEGEARNDRRLGRWDGLVASGRAAWYVKPASAHLFLVSAEFGGSWRQRLPVQLTLGDHVGGVRGFDGSRVAGSSRTVVRAEERWSLPTRTPRIALGIAGFVDAGRVRAGDAPFGVNSRTAVGVGAGMLAALPARSSRLWRLDIAFPVTADADSHWSVRLSSAWTRRFWREPADVAQARAGAAPSTIFTWP